ncbi:Alpha/Beta hydrolase protein [Cercophora newfieldiana]|uniref:Alpha/Beta hydrolase protein n=1 Tax=Cercophora newfieldiana TaxID=92897 RepID=A0AA39Y149_9PEZI|nr:Alpha/Beta hydrolase protein [Cercophora newfieldiana]
MSISQRTLTSCLLSVTGAVCFVQAAPASRPPSTRGGCSRVVFNLPVTAENYVFVRPPDPNSEPSIQAFIVDFFTTGPDKFIIGTHTVNETFAVNAVYCKPTRKTKHRNTLQILIHGITYNSTMWSGYGFGDQYNWHAHANRAGYHTLAIDRLGHGLNSRSYDPTSIIQTPLHIETHHQLVTALRTSKSNPLSRTFSKIILVGHSYGSVLITAQARRYPSDADVLILTGFSNFVSGGTVVLEFEPAAIHDASRFPSVPYGYLVFQNKDDRDGFYHPGHHDPAIAAHDFAWEDIVTTGEFASSSGDAMWGAAKGYRGKVLVVTGVYDREFCVPSVEECEGILKGTVEGLFPDRERGGYVAVRDAAHDLTLHYSAEETFERVIGIVGGW